MAMNNPFALLSDSITSVVAASASLLCAIRTAPNQQVTGVLFQPDAIVTTDQALPVVEANSVVLSNRAVVSARQVARDPSLNLAVLRLETPVAAVLPECAVPPVGTLVVLLGAEPDASPTVRVSVIHRFLRTTDGLAPVLDLPPASVASGGAVFNPNGHMIGIAALGPGGEAIVIPSALIQRLFGQPAAGANPMPSPAPGGITQGRRGWLGVALQPITVPDQLIQKAGQNSGRMVVNITTGGPADKAGLRVGDVLLALNDTTTTGPHALRAFLGADRIGSSVEVKLLRDGSVLTTHLTVGAQ